LEIGSPEDFFFSTRLRFFPKREKTYFLGVPLLQSRGFLANIKANLKVSEFFKPFSCLLAK